MLLQKPPHRPLGHQHTPAAVNQQSYLRVRKKKLLMENAVALRDPGLRPFAGQEVDGAPGDADDVSCPGQVALSFLVGILIDCGSFAFACQLLESSALQ